MLTELVDFNYYSKNYGGSSIPESSFKEKVIEASSKINYYTSRRITLNNLNDDIKDATCEIAELIYSREKSLEDLNDNNIVASETVGPHTISYANKSALQEKRILSDEQIEKKCYEVCYRYLANTGLMYRGEIL